MAARAAATSSDAALRSCMPSVRRTIRSPSSRVVAPDCIDVIQQAVLGTGGNRELATESRVESRRGSGAAHGLPWSVFGRQETRQAGSTDPDGMATFHAGGSIDALANSYLCAYGLLQRVKLLDRRGALRY